MQLGDPSGRLERPGTARRILLILGVVATAAVTGLASTAVVVAVTADDPIVEPAALPKTVLPPNDEPVPVLAGSGGQGEVPSQAGLAGVLGPALQAPELGGATVASVIDPVTGETLFEQGGTSQVIPGSTTKVFIAVAASVAVPPGTRLTTKVVAGDEPGEIVLVGGGDPTLSTVPESAAYPGAATIAALAEAVAASDAGQISKITVDTSLFTGPSIGTGWAPEDAPSTYAAPITAVMVDGGRVSADAKNRSATPDLDAGHALATALGVPGAAVVNGTAPEGATELGSVRSAPVTRLIEQALTQSDNVLAEILARQVAIATGNPASFEGGAKGVRDTLAGLDVDLDGVSLLDGSGLSTENRVTAASLTSVLAIAASPSRGRPHVVLSGLPIGGFNGTLADRYRSDGSLAGAGSVRAKTGTLDGVSALAGVVKTAGGKLLVFAFVANHGAPVGSTDPAEAALDAAASAIATCGC